MLTCRPSGSTTAGMFVSENESCKHTCVQISFYYTVSLMRPREHTSACMQRGAKLPERPSLAPMCEGHACAVLATQCLEQVQEEGDSSASLPFLLLVASLVISAAQRLNFFC
jgi:hypothetical protein